MADEDLLTRIHQLTDEERRLEEAHVREPLSDPELARLHEVERILDQLWDLMRQRRALPGHSAGKVTRALNAPSGQDSEMEFEVTRAVDEDRPIVRRLLQLYHYDFSEFNGADVDPHGEYLHRYFDEYWLDDDRAAFLIRVDGALAGFALVYTGDPHDVAEFFVMRKYRLVGVGRCAATLLFGRIPGRWTVRQQLTNPAAIEFWRMAIPYPFEEAELNGEMVQSFTAESVPGQ